MTIYHKHHIIPKFLGGTDEPSNLILLSVEEHAEAHKNLYEEYGHWQDFVAWQGLMKQLDKVEITKIKLSEAGKKGASMSAKPWWTDGSNSVRSNECPGEKWYRGRPSPGHWWTNGIEIVRNKTCPHEGWYRGQPPRSEAAKKNISKGMIGNQNRKKKRAE